MITRSLTDVFLMFRERSAHKLMNVLPIEEDRQLLIPEQCKSCSENDEWWFQSILRTRRRLADIEMKIQRLIALHAKHVTRPSLENLNEEEGRIDALTQEITAALDGCCQMIQSLSLFDEHSVQQRQLNHNAKRLLLKRLQEKVTIFRKSQASYLHRIRQREETNSCFEIRIDDDSPFESQVIDMRELEQLEAREKQIKSVMQSITDVNQVFKDVAILIQDQANFIDRIDYNIERTHVDIEHGFQQLQHANQHQSQHRRLVAIVATLSSAVIIIILLILFARI